MINDDPIWLVDLIEDYGHVMGLTLDPTPEQLRTYRLQCADYLEARSLDAGVEQAALLRRASANMRQLAEVTS